MKTKVRRILLLLLLISAAITARALGWSVHDTLFTRGSYAEIPVYIDEEINQYTISSYMMEISYDPGILVILEVKTEGTVAQTCGIPAIGFPRPGIVSISAASAGYMSGSGILLILRVKLLNSGYFRLEFTDSKHNYFDEGSPAVTTSGAWINCQEAVGLQLWCENRELAPGDSTWLSAGGASGTVSWSVSDNTVASIDSEGKLMALKAGNITVYATDEASVTDSLGGILIHPVKVSIDSRLTEFRESRVEIPVYFHSTEDVTIFSGSLTLLYNTSLLKVDSMASGTLIGNAANVMHPIEGGLKFSFATTQAIGHDGILCKLIMTVQANEETYSYLELSDLVFNEQLTVLKSNGFFVVKEFEPLYLTIPETDLLTGDSIQLSVVDYYTPPLKWSVSNPELAVVDANGLLKTLKSGNFRVSAQDAAGGKATSPWFTVTDTRLRFPEISHCITDSLIQVPVELERLPNESVLSVEFKLSYDAGKLEFRGLSGDVAPGWMQLAAATNGTISFAASGSSRLSGSGQLAMFTFRTDNAYNADPYAGFELKDIRLNEGNPSTNTYIYKSIYAKPLPDKPYSLQGDTLILSAGVSFMLQVYSNSTIYNWTLPPGISGYSETDVMELTANNSFETGDVSVVALNECGESEKLTIHLKRDLISKLETAEGGITVFPNPAQSSITICSDREARVVLTDIAGRKISQQTLYIGVNITDISALAPGIYLLSITDTKKTTTFKLRKL